MHPALKSLDLLSLIFSQDELNPPRDEEDSWDLIDDPPDDLARFLLVCKLWFEPVAAQLWKYHSDVNAILNCLAAMHDESGVSLPVIRDNNYSLMSI